MWIMETKVSSLKRAGVPIWSTLGSTPGAPITIVVKALDEIMVTECSKRVPCGQIRAFWCNQGFTYFCGTLVKRDG